MNVFITGSLGFIGSHLKEYLSSKYTDYNLFTPSSKELDLTNEYAVDQYISNKNIDLIVHLANRGGDRATINMKNITEYNLRIFFNLIKHEKNVEKIISFGSGAEYGKHKPIVEAREEDALKALPLDEYGFYKAITSRYIERCDKIVQLRLFGVYGEYENYRIRFITNSIIKNLFKLPITIYKNVFFDYIYVYDLCKIIDWFMHNNQKEKIYNATRGQKTDLITLAHIINDISDFKSEIIILNEGLNNEYTSNNEKLMAELGNFNFTSHKDAIIKIRNYFKANSYKLDIKTVKNDSYLEFIDKMWKEQ